jgi:hypothetical protein
MEQNPVGETEKKLNFFSRIFLKIVNSIPSSNQDWVIIVSVFLLFGIWILDLFIVDPIPLIDEIALPIITAYISKWYIERKNKGK